MDSLQTTEPSRHNLNTSFLRLSAEPRNPIYEVVVVRERPIRIKILGTHNSPVYVPTVLIQPELAHTWRAIRHEVLPVYYGNKNFVIEIYCLRDIFLAEDWLRAIGRGNRELMGKVLVTWRGYAGFLRLRSYRPRRATFVVDMRLIGRTKLYGE